MKRQSIAKIVAITLLASAGWLLAVVVSGLFEPGSILGRVVFGAIVFFVILILVISFYRYEKSSKSRKFRLSSQLNSKT